MKVILKIFSFENVILHLLQKCYGDNAFSKAALFGAYGSNLLTMILWALHSYFNSSEAESEI